MNIYSFTSFPQALQPVSCKFVSLSFLSPQERSGSCWVGLVLVDFCFLCFLLHRPYSLCYRVSPLWGCCLNFVKIIKFFYYSSLLFLPLCCKRKNSFCCSISLRSSSSVGRNVRYFAWNSLSLSFSIEYRAISLLV